MILIDEALEAAILLCIQNDKIMSYSCVNTVAANQDI